MAARNTPSKAQKTKTPEVVLINPTTSAMPYTEQGNLLGAGERVTVPELDAIGQAAVDAGYLITEDASATGETGSEGSSESGGGKEAPAAGESASGSEPADS